MHFSPAQVVPAPGKYLIRLTPPESVTEGGVILPSAKQLSDATGKPTRSSIPESATATIVAVGGEHGGTPPAWEVGDVVLLTGSISVVTTKGQGDGTDEYGLIDWYQAVGRIDVDAKPTPVLCS